jgi:hypothetical protein
MVAAEAAVVVAAEASVKAHSRARRPTKVAARPRARCTRIDTSPRRCPISPNTSDAWLDDDVHASPDTGDSAPVTRLQAALAGRAYGL